MKLVIDIILKMGIYQVYKMNKGVRKLDMKEILESLVLFGLLGVAIILGMCL